MTHLLKVRSIRALAAGVSRSYLAIAPQFVGQISKFSYFYSGSLVSPKDVELS